MLRLEPPSCSSYISHDDIRPATTSNHALFPKYHHICHVCTLNCEREFVAEIIITSCYAHLCLCRHFNPSNVRRLSSKAQGRKDIFKSSKPCDVVIHWVPLTEYSLMSTPMPFFWFLALIFYWPKLATTSIRVKSGTCLSV